MPLRTELWLKKAGILLAWAGVVLAAGALVWAALHWVLPFFAPFFVAFALAFLLRRPVRFLARTAGIRRRPAAGLLLCLFAALVLGGAGYLAARLLLLAKLALARLPQLYAAWFEPLLQSAAQQLSQAFGRHGVPADSAAWLDSVTGMLQQLTAGLAGVVGGAVTALPGMLIPFVFACIATVYFTLDYDCLAQSAAQRLGQANWQRLQTLKNHTFSFAGRLLRAYILLFGLTFVQLCVGFWLLGVPGAPGLALLAALVDALPVLGVGTVLLPWAAVCALGGRGGFALGLLALYAVVWVVRQLCEPRLVGRQLGLHPLASLFFLYAGLRLFGVFGAVVLPVAATLCWQIGKTVLQNDAREPPSGEGRGKTAPVEDAAEKRRSVPE